MGKRAKSWFGWEALLIIAAILGCGTMCVVFAMAMGATIIYGGGGVP